MSRKTAKPATPVYLERVALWYMERFPASVSRVRRALEKRVRRSVEELGTDAAEGAAAVDAVISRLTGLGYLNDERVAASRVATLRRRGKSASAIRGALRALGIASAIIDEALEADRSTGEPELEAARLLARRRRLGPHRREPAGPDERRKDLAKLARAGFRYDIAQRVLDEEE